MGFPGDWWQIPAHPYLGQCVYLCAPQNTMFLIRSAAFVLKQCSGGLVALAFLSLTGCTSIKVALGLRTRLQDVPVTSLSASLSPGPSLAPGETARLVIVAATNDGKQLVTVGPGHGKVLFSSFTYTSTIAQVGKRGVVSLPADPRISEGRLPHIRITAINHPEVSADLDVPVRYDVDFKADLSGKAGFDGADGTAGAAGRAGLDGSKDPNNASAGGDGGPGDDGGPGGDGGNGEPGSAVHVWLTLKAAPHPLLQARVADGSDEELFLIDPNGGSLEVDANGGIGGAGGRGGAGGAGGAGGSGTPDGKTGSAGGNGPDGQPGKNGAPGTIIVSVDPQAKPFLDRLYLSNYGDGVRVDHYPPALNAVTHLAKADSPVAPKATTSGALARLANKIFVRYPSPPSAAVAGPTPEIRVESVPAIW